MSSLFLILPVPKRGNWNLRHTVKNVWEIHVHYDQDKD